jgi:protocatechuate 3,4-dioxygenase beta subunit
MSGRVLDADGTPAAGVHLYVYHADGQGEYALPAQVFNRIAGVLRTNDRGEYRFRSILPGVYAGTGGHVHFEVWKGDRPVLAHSVSLYGAPGVAFPSRWTRRAIEEWSSRIAVVTRDSSGIYHCHHDLKLTDMSESGESYESLMQAWRNRYGDGHP